MNIQYYDVSFICLTFLLFRNPFISKLLCFHILYILCVGLAHIKYCI